MAVTKYTAAKINILLDITSTLDNGYHAIYSIMQSVGLYDKISVEKNGSGLIRLDCADPGIPLNESNTAYRAAKLFFEHTGISGQGVNISIVKNIPKEGGLAGGSADAAGVLVCMNELYETGLSKRELCEIGVKIGADVPFCIRGGTMLAQNIGDVLSRLPSLPECKILLVKPNSGVSTAEAYKAFDAKDWIRHPNRDYALKAAVARDLRALCRYSSNVFEQAVEIPERVEIKSVMRAHGALHTFMTGSGSVICAIFEDSPSAEECKKELEKTYDSVFLTNPVARGIEETIL